MSTKGLKAIAAHISREFVIRVIKLCPGGETSLRERFERDLHLVLQSFLISPLSRICPPTFRLLYLLTF